MTEKKQDEPSHYFFKHVHLGGGKLALAICEIVVVKVLPADSEEDWDNASAEIERMEADYRKEKYMHVDEERPQGVVKNEPAAHGEEPAEPVVKNAPGAWRKEGNND